MFVRKRKLKVISRYCMSLSFASNLCASNDKYHILVNSCRNTIVKYAQCNRRVNSWFSDFHWIWPFASINIITILVLILWQVQWPLLVLIWIVSLWLSYMLKTHRRTCLLHKICLQNNISETPIIVNDAELKDNISEYI